MNKLSERSGGNCGLWTSVGLAAALTIMSAARADEPNCECRVQGNLNQIGIPLLGQLPYVGRLFEYPLSAGKPESCADHLQRVGIDFEIGQPMPGRGVIIVKRLECQQCAAEGDAEAKCDKEHCCECEVVKATLAAKHAAGHSADDKPTWEQIVGMASEKAALEATLEAHSEIAAAKEEIFESLAELMAEKAVLEAKLELQGEREELSKQVQKLTAENARLKAQVELASLRTEMLQKTMQVAVENEHLKHRVAELERQSVESTAARTAKRNPTSKKAR
jgi:hypothetical protein